MSSMTEPDGAFASMRARIAATGAKTPVSASMRRTTSAKGVPVHTGCAPPGRSGSCDPSASPSPAEGLVDCDERDCGILLALHQLVLGRVDGALRVEDREEVLQTARVPVGGQLERAAVRGDGSAQRIAPPQLAPVGRERVLDLFERGEDGLLILEERLFLPRLLHPDVRPDASAREDRPAEA